MLYESFTPRGRRRCNENHVYINNSYLIINKPNKTYRRVIARTYCKNVNWKWLALFSWICSSAQWVLQSHWRHLAKPHSALVMGTQVFANSLIKKHKEMQSCNPMTNTQYEHLAWWCNSKLSSVYVFFFVCVLFFDNPRWPSSIQKSQDKK